MSELLKVCLTELGDTLHVEELLIKALPKLSAATFAPDLKKTLDNIFVQTQSHLTRIQRVFGYFGVPAREKKCEGMLGILIEAQQVMQRSKPSPSRDATLVCIARKAAAYKLISYESLLSWAKLVKEKEAVKLLSATCSEQKAALEKLTSFAPICDSRAAEEATEEPPRAIPRVATPRKPKDLRERIMGTTFRF